MNQLPLMIAGRRVWYMRVFSVLVNLSIPWSYVVTLVVKPASEATCTRILLANCAVPSVRFVTAETSGLLVLVGMVGVTIGYISYRLRNAIWYGERVAAA